MWRKRLLDAVGVFKASRGVALEHIALRRHQLDIYTKTSSLARSSNSQTDPVTSTIRNTSATADRPGQSLKNEAGQVITMPSQASVYEGRRPFEKRYGNKQEKFYDESEANTTAQPLPDNELVGRRAKAKENPLPDGSIPPTSSAFNMKSQNEETFSDVSPTATGPDALIADDEGIENCLQPASSDRIMILGPEQDSTSPGPDHACELQHNAEQIIPSVYAEPQATSSEEAQDVFYARTQKQTEVLSSLPTAKLHKAIGGIQRGDCDITSERVNEDIFYSIEKKKQKEPISTVEAVRNQEKPSDDMYSEIFHSPRVAKMLKGGRKQELTMENPDFHALHDKLLMDTKKWQGEAQENFDIRPSGQVSSKASDHERANHSNTSMKTDTEDVRKLAEDLVQDSGSAPSTKQGISEDIAANIANAPYEMHESPVPSSRLGRLWQFGGLATSMAFGAVGESFRRATNNGNPVPGSLMLSARNMEILVAKLSKMRGAALKLGQMMSFQDSKILPPAIAQVLQRVQDSADYMPASQRDSVLASNLGSDWQAHFSSFDDIPMAAASIGQVHGAVLKSTGARVAVKVQYPGVADSIDSDLNNLSILLTASRLLPKGLYLEKTIGNARTELGWECDYIREAECARRFKRLLHNEQDVFIVPSIIDEASGPQVLTMEMMEGVGVTKIQEFTQEQKDWIGTQILRLCLREIIEFRFMQTDPNWTNFLFNSKTKKLELLDFGASRNFPDEFIEPYIRIIIAASRIDRDTCRDLSIQLGYLTGYESQAMLNAHISSILTLAEPFSENSPQIYDFRNQTITERIRGLIPVMVRERLAPPPEETYSLHRKLSGAFLLCARLGSRVRCRDLFDNAIKRASVT